MVWVSTEVLEEIIRPFSFQFSGCQKHRSASQKCGAQPSVSTQRGQRWSSPVSPPQCHQQLSPAHFALLHGLVTIRAL